MFYRYGFVAAKELRRGSGQTDEPDPKLRKAAGKTAAG